MNIFGLDTWSAVFVQSSQDLWFSFIQFTPKLLAAVVFFVVGWLLGNVIARALEQVFGSLKVDSLLRSIGVENFFRKAGMNLNSGYFVGQIVKWFVIVVALLPSLSVVGLDTTADFLKDDVLGFLPKVVIAALVLIIATIVADALSKTVVASAKTMSLSSANMLGSIAKYAVWIFALIIALGELGIAEYYMNVLYTGIIVMLSIGGALAFGLGGRDAAAKFIAKVSEEVSQK